MSSYIQYVREEEKNNIVADGFFGDGIIELIVRINVCLADWQRSIDAIESSYLSEKVRWVRNWMEKKGNSLLLSLMAQASVGPPTQRFELNRKAELLLEVCQALESVEGDPEDKYESMLNWVLEIPSILRELIQEEALLLASDRMESPYKQELKQFHQFDFGWDDTITAA